MIKTSLNDLNEDDIKYAALSGVIGGIFMIIFEMIISISEKGFWAPIRAISAVFGMGIKDPVTQYDFFVAPIMAGIVIHVLFSIFFGIVFFILFYESLKKYSSVTGVAVSAVWGFVVYVILFIVILRLPILSWGRIMLDVVPQWAWMLGNIIFGVVVFMSLRSMRKLLSV